MSHETFLPFEVLAFRFEFGESAGESLVNRGIFRDTVHIRNQIKEFNNFVDFYLDNQPMPTLHSTHGEDLRKFVFRKENHVKFGCQSAKHLINAFNLGDKNFQSQLQTLFKKKLVVAKCFLVRPAITETVFGEIVYFSEFEQLVDSTDNIDEFMSW